MSEKTRLPLIVFARSIQGDRADAPDPKVTLEVEAETGEIYELAFSLRGIVSTSVRALQWMPLRDAIKDLPEPEFRRGHSGQSARAIVFGDEDPHAEA